MSSSRSVILFHYIKSSFFRVIYAEGAYGGVTPRGKLHFSLYNERPAIPRLTEVDVAEDGVTTSGPERIVETRAGIVREVETQILMDLPVAIEFHSWLGSQILKAQKISEENKKNGK
jgi:hypothetical protein